MNELQQYITNFDNDADDELTFEDFKQLVHDMPPVEMKLSYSPGRFLGIDYLTFLQVGIAGFWWSDGKWKFDIYDRGDVGYLR